MNFNLKVEEINYIKFSYNGKKGYKKDFRAIVKSYGDKTLIAYAKNQGNLHADLPQEVTLFFICNDGVYNASCQLKSIEIEEPYAIYVFEKPQNILYEQKREFFRIPAVFDCTYYITNDNQTTEYKTKSTDLSANGISILIPNTENPEAFSIITIFLDGKQITAPIKYIRNEKYNDSYKYSFTFTDLKEKDRDFISQFCFQKQLERKRNSLK